MQVTKAHDYQAVNRAEDSKFLTMIKIKEKRVIGNYFREQFSRRLLWRECKSKRSKRVWIKMKKVNLRLNVRVIIFSVINIHNLI